MKHVVRGDTLDLGDMIKTRAAAFKRGGKAGKVLEVYDTKEHFEASSPMAVLHASGKVVRKTPGAEDAVGKARKPSKKAKVSHEGGGEEEEEEQEKWPEYQASMWSPAREEEEEEEDEEEDDGGDGAHPTPSPSRGRGGGRGRGRPLCVRGRGAGGGRGTIETGRPLWTAGDGTPGAEVPAERRSGQQTAERQQRDRYAYPDDSSDEEPDKPDKPAKGKPAKPASKPATKPATKPAAPPKARPPKPRAATTTVSELQAKLEVTEDRTRPKPPFAPTLRNCDVCVLCTAHPDEPVRNPDAFGWRAVITATKPKVVRGKKSNDKKDWVRSHCSPLHPTASHCSSRLCLADPARGQLD